LEGGGGRQARPTPAEHVLPGRPNLFTAPGHELDSLEDEISPPPRFLGRIGGLTRVLKPERQCLYQLDMAEVKSLRLHRRPEVRGPPCVWATPPRVAPCCSAPPARIVTTGPSMSIYGNNCLITSILLPLPPHVSAVVRSSTSIRLIRRRGERPSVGSSTTPPPRPLLSKVYPPLITIYGPTTLDSTPLGTSPSSPSLLPYMDPQPSILLPRRDKPLPSKVYPP